MTNRQVDPYNFFYIERAQFCSDASYVFELKFSGRRPVRWSFFVTGDADGFSPYSTKGPHPWGLTPGVLGDREDLS